MSQKSTAAGSASVPIALRRDSKRSSSRPPPCMLNVQQGALRRLHPSGAPANGILKFTSGHPPFKNALNERPNLSPTLDHPHIHQRPAPGVDERRERPDVIGELLGLQL